MFNIVTKSIVDNGAGWLIVVADLGDLLNQTIYLRPEAIANRRVGYELATDDEALDAILREHALRLHDDVAPKSEALVDQLGGIDDRFTVQWDKTAATDRDACLEQSADIIAAAVEIFTPRKPDAEETP